MIIPSRTMTIYDCGKSNYTYLNRVLFRHRLLEHPMASMLFQPFTLRELTLPNRVVVSPMCQYSAKNGNASDWHILHLGQYAVSGAGLLIIEATGVEPEGRITADCLGLWSDENEQALARVLQFVRPFSSMPIGIQLSHAGRKASVLRPGQGRGNLAREQGGWQTVGPTSEPFAPGWQAPAALDKEGMRRVRQAFVQAAERADRLGLDLLEIHAAHGYLLSSFLSPLGNSRTDNYGGSRDNRMRFPLEVFEAVRHVWPQHKPMGVRFNGSDWLHGGLTSEDAVAFAMELKARGCDYMDLSSGGNAPAAIPLQPGYQVPYAAQVRREASVPTMCVGLIRDPRHAEAIVEQGEADLVGLGRGLLNNPRWVWHAAEELGAEAQVPHQYLRGATRAGIPPPDAIIARQGA
jgi:2,4-dienoyl-CoA reductase-like NADH-dependent reductase (Old Yellow Enzyme family)